MLLGTQDKDFFPEEIGEKLQFVKDMGFQCFEIDGKLLVENVEKVKKAVEETGIPVLTALQWLPGLDRRFYRRETAKRRGGSERDPPGHQRSRWDRRGRSCRLGDVYLPAAADGIAKK